MSTIQRVIVICVALICVTAVVITLAITGPDANPDPEERHLGTARVTISYGGGGGPSLAKVPSVIVGQKCAEGFDAVEITKQGALRDTVRTYPCPER